jgi:hypothetical protein
MLFVTCIVVFKYCCRVRTFTLALHALAHRRNVACSVSTQYQLSHDTATNERPVLSANVNSVRVAMERCSRVHISTCVEGDFNPSNRNPLIATYSSVRM